MNAETIERIKLGFVALYQSNIEVKKVVDDFFVSLSNIFKHTSMDTYQKQGYPLGKSIRGFKKWQYRQMNK